MRRNQKKEGGARKNFGFSIYVISIYQVAARDENAGLNKLRGGAGEGGPGFAREAPLFGA